MVPPLLQPEGCTWAGTPNFDQLAAEPPDPPQLHGLCGAHDPLDDRPKAKAFARTPVSVLSHMNNSQCMRPQLIDSASDLHARLHTPHYKEACDACIPVSTEDHSLAGNIKFYEQHAAARSNLAEYVQSSELALTMAIKQRNPRKALDSASSLEGFHVHSKCQETHTCEVNHHQPLAAPAELHAQDALSTCQAAPSAPHRLPAELRPCQEVIPSPYAATLPRSHLAAVLSALESSHVLQGRVAAAAHTTARQRTPIALQGSRDCSPVCATLPPSLPYKSPLGWREQISIKINTSHRVTDLPTDTVHRLQTAIAHCHGGRSAKQHHVRLVTGAAVRPGCVRIVLETSRLPRGTRPVSTQAPSAAVAPSDGSTWDSCSSEAAAASAEFEQLAVEVVASLGLDPAQLSHQDHVDIQVEGVLVRATWDAILGQWRSTCLPLHTTPGLLGYAVQAKFVGEPMPYSLPSDAFPDVPVHDLQFSCQVELPQGLRVVGYIPTDGSSQEAGPSGSGPSEVQEGVMQLRNQEQHPVQPAVATHGHESMGVNEVQVLVQLLGNYVATHVTQVGQVVPADPGASSGSEQLVDLLVGVDMPLPSTPTTSSHAKPMWCKLELWASGLLLDWCIVALTDAMHESTSRLPGQADITRPQQPHTGTASASTQRTPTDDLRPRPGDQTGQIVADSTAAGMVEASEAAAGHGRRRSKLSDVVSWLSAPRPVADLAAHRVPAATASPDHILTPPMSLSHVYLTQTSDGAEQPSEEAAAVASTSTANATTSAAPSSSAAPASASATATAAAATSAHGRKDAQLRVRKAWRAQLASAADVADSEDEAQRAGRAAFMADLATWQSMLEDAEAQMFMEAVAAAGEGAGAGLEMEPVLPLDGRAGAPLRLSLSPALVRYAAVLVRALLRHAVQCGMRGVAAHLVMGMRSPAGQRLLAASTRPEELSSTPTPWAEAGGSIAAPGAAGGAVADGWWPLDDVAEGFLLLQLATNSSTPGMVDDVKTWLDLGRWGSREGSNTSAAEQGSAGAASALPSSAAGRSVLSAAQPSAVRRVGGGVRFLLQQGADLSLAWGGILCALCLSSAVWLFSSMTRTVVSVSVLGLTCSSGLILSCLGQYICGCPQKQQQGIWLVAIVAGLVSVGGHQAHSMGAFQVYSPWVEQLVAAGEWLLARGVDLAALPPALAGAAQVHSPLRGLLSTLIASAYMLMLHACALPPVDCILRTLAVTSLALMYARALGTGSTRNTNATLTTTVPAPDGSVPSPSHTAQ